MAFNPNFVPWLSALGVIGLAIGYGIGRVFLDLNGQQALLPAFWGLAAGTLAGLIVRVALRGRGASAPTAEDPPA